VGPVIESAYWEKNQNLANKIHFSPQNSFDCVEIIFLGQKNEKIHHKENTRVSISGAEI
jgi:hypothetical protein